MPMTNIPSNPRNTGKVLASEFSISKTAAITIKMIPTNSAIFWNTMLLILINPRNCISFLLNAYLYAIIGANCEKTGLTFTIHTLKWHKILRQIGWNFNSSKENYLECKNARGIICLARVSVVCLGIIMGVLSAAVSTEFLCYIYGFLTFFAIVQ